MPQSFGAVCCTATNSDTDMAVRRNPPCGYLRLEWGEPVSLQRCLSALSEQCGMMERSTYIRQWVQKWEVTL